MLTESHLSALRIIMEAAYLTPSLSWALTGSTSFALQGVEVSARDIDIMTDEQGAYELERRLFRYSVKPVRYSEAERIRSHFGLLHICGVTRRSWAAFKSGCPAELGNRPLRLRPSRNLSSTAA